MPSVDRCEVCSVRLPAVQRKDTRYCGSTCRVRASRARREGRPSTADLRRRWAWSRTPTETRSWVLLWYRRLAHSPLRALATKHRETQALHAQLADAQATIRQQAAELIALRQQLAAQAEQSAHDAAASVEGHNKLQAELTTTRESSASQNKRLADLDRQLSEAVRQRDLARHDARTVRAERDIAQERVCRTEAAVEKMGRLLTIKSREADDQRTAYNHARRRVVRLRRKLVQVRTLYSQHVQVLHAVHQRLSSARQAASRRQTEQAQSLNIAQARIAEQEKELKALTDDAGRLSQEVSAYQAQAEQHRALLQQADERDAHYKDRLAQAKTVCETLANAVTAIKDSAKNAHQALASYKSSTEAELTALRAFRARQESPPPEIADLKKQLIELEIRRGHAESQRDEAKRVLQIRTDLYKYYDWCNSRRVLDLQNQIRELGAEPRETVFEEDEKK